MNKDITLEDLDFYLTKLDSNSIVWQKVIEINNDFHSEVLIFDLDEKELEIINIDHIELDLFNAIFNEYKKIGWLDE